MVGNLGRRLVGGNGQGDGVGDHTSMTIVPHINSAQFIPV